MKAIAFDLGDTLVEYEGLPPSWEAHYETAITELARFLGIPVSDFSLRSACKILRRYNTRLTPRTHEVAFAEILADLLVAIEGRFSGDTDAAASAFFSVFRQRLRCFHDTAAKLRSLRQNGIQIGVLTDVPYGMPRRLVLEDMETSGVLSLVDEVVTSVDAGVRKPDPRGLELLASRLHVQPHEMLFVGNEKKDVEVALAFGCDSALLDRNQDLPAWKQHRTISTLAEL